MDCIVRRAVIGDADSLFTLVCQFATSFQPDRASFELCIEQILPDESAWLAVAECDGRLVGYCLGFDHYAFYANGRVAWVEEIMVEADWRRKGIGQSLMEAFEAWASSRGARLVALATRRAAPFYLALGYQESAVFFRKLIGG
jgi:GNAT superfamily N-acetyltransferase